MQDHFMSLGSYLDYVVSIYDYSRGVAELSAGGVGKEIKEFKEFGD